ncbi:MAG: helix-turn-helix transcriptional regulator [Ferruginibacter sp.]
MEREIYHIHTISQLHEAQNLPKPIHPLISIVDVSQWVIEEKWIGVKTTADLYSIALKDKSCGLMYGRHLYDFDEGVLIFTAPRQVNGVTKAQKLNEINGWMLFFHPDLIRNTPLAGIIGNYKFFDYDVYEALHLSATEQQTITDCVTMIKNEISENIDSHSQTIIASSLELMLNLSARYYERQFITRKKNNSDVVIQIEKLLKEYFKSDELNEKGLPAVKYLAAKVHLSPNYLSDLLRKETGMNTQDHIHHYLIEEAKKILLGTNKSISEIAYRLGFEYPQYFSKLFKQKTGNTPQEFRDMN